jgi:NAD(P)-dependent dehydrogenase (short-subunit alcohol dehydrogenase family)
MSESKRVFITGGASGLGRALGERYAAAGWRVCLADIHARRGAEALAALQARGAEVAFLQCDVTCDEALAQAAAWLENAWGGVDLVFNNAGVAVVGPIEDVPLEDWQWILDVNLLGVVRGCRAFTRLLKRQGGGHLVNIASMAGLVHPPFMAPYNAAKAAVVALSETLQAELAPHGIKVSVVCPLFFRTHLLETARCPDPEWLCKVKGLVTEAQLGAEDIAKEVYRQVEQGTFRILTDNGGRRAWQLKRWLPFSLFSQMLRLRGWASTSR